MIRDVRVIPLLIAVALSTVAHADERDPCLKEKKHDVCEQLSSAFHAGKRFSLLKSDAAKLAAYREFVESVDREACEGGAREKQCFYVIELLKEEPESAAREKRLEALRDKACERSESYGCQERKKALGAEVNDEKSCLQDKRVEGCLAAMNRTLINLNRTPKTDTAPRAALRTKLLQLAAIACDAGERSACNEEVGALRLVPMSAAEEARQLVVLAKLCSLQDTAACQALAEKKGATQPKAEDKVLSACLAGSDAQRCYRPAQDEFIRAAEFHSAIAEKPQFVPQYTESLQRLLQLSVKACRLNSGEGCSLALRAIRLPSPPTAEQLTAIMKAADDLCAGGKQPFCPVAAELKVTGGKPKERVASDKDVAATLALLKKKGDLAGANLEGKQLDGINLAGVNLTGANLSRASLWKADLGRAKLDGANLERAQLVEAIIGLATLVGASAPGMNLENAQGSFASARDAKLANAVLHDTLDGAELTGANLEGAFLKDCNWSKKDLRKVSLRDVTFSGCNLNEANFSGVDLTGSDFREATVVETNFEQATLDKAKVGLVLLKRTNLTNASMKGVDGERVIFDSSKMRGLNLTGANLLEAGFSGPTDISGAIFDRATLCGTGIEKVKGYASASLNGAKKVCQ